MINISRILVLADIHGNIQATSKLLSIIKKQNWGIDLIIIAGDLPETTPIRLMLQYILSHGNLSKTKYTRWVYKERGRYQFINYQINSIRAILTLLGSLGVPIVYVPGNVDCYEAQNAVKAWSASEVFFLDANKMSFGSLRIWGCGGSEFTPNKYETPLCDMEFYANDFSSRMKPLYEINPDTQSKFDILITHEPPAFCFETTEGTIKGGSNNITSLIRYIKPKIVIFGHYHEIPLIKKENNMILINPGPLTCYRFAIINIKEKSVKAGIKKMNPNVSDFKNIIYSYRFTEQYKDFKFVGLKRK